MICKECNRDIDVNIDNFEITYFGSLNCCDCAAKWLEEEPAANTEQIHKGETDENNFDTKKV
jgi:hypothetical protein